jgi:hypothetical protein
MTIRFAILMGVTGLNFALAALMSGPPSSAVARGPLEGCFGSNPRGHYRIEPRTSELTCRDVKAFLILLPDAIGRWPVTDRNPVKNTISRWICRTYPAATYHLRVRCRHDGRYFVVLGVGRDST